MALFGGKSKVDESDPRSVWEQFFKLAMKNEWKQSLAMLNILETLDRANPQVFMKLGDIQQRLGSKTEAVDAYHRAAVLIEEANELQKALATYKIILRLNPDDAKAAERSKAILEFMSGEAPTEAEQYDTPAESDPASYDPAQAPPASEPEPTSEPTPEPTPAAAPTPPVQTSAESAPPAQAAPAAPTAASDSAQASAGSDSAQATAAPAGKPKNLREAFARHPIFSVLSDEEIKDMSTRSNHVTFKEGEAVIAEDSEGDSIYIIKKGRARVTSTVMGKTMQLANLGGLAFFGEGGFLTGAPRTASVVASSDIELMEIPKRLMSDIIISNPAVLGKLVDLLRARASKSPR